MDLFKGRVPWWPFFTLTQNLWMARLGGFSGASLGVTWSLAIEEQFYLTLPFVVRRLAPKNLIYLVAGIIFGAPVLRALLIRHLSYGAFAVYVLMPCRADALGLGVLCAILVRRERIWNYLLTHRAWIYAVSAIFGLCIAAITFRHIQIFTDALYGLEYSVLALFYAFALLIAVTGEDKFVKAVFCNKFLMRLGVVAYGTYLLHYIFINSLRFLLISHISLPPVTVFLGAPLLGVVVAVAVAGISWRFFEKPLVNRARHYRY
jgi:peptidoglycan/LPS O-acetylase OafA/YrhL